MTVRSAKASGLPPATLTPIGDLLFSASEPGAWYDPSDMSTLFQDSAGTVPVTAVEQPVGLILDKARPIVTNGDVRMNVLPSEAADWAGGNNTVVGNKIIPNTTNGAHGPYIGIPGTGLDYIIKVKVKAAGYSKFYISDGSNGRVHAAYDLANGTVISAVSNIPHDAAIVYLGAGVYELSVKVNAVTGLAVIITPYPDTGATLSPYGASFAGDGVSGVEVYAVDARLVTQADTLPRYQYTPANTWSRFIGSTHATQATTTKRPVLSRRVNIFTESEFRNGVTDAPTRDGLLTATTMAGYLGAIAFGHNGATSSYAYKGNILTAGVSYALSVVVEMTDGLPPAFGSANQEAASNTFALVLSGAAISPLTYVVQELSGGRFRVTATATGSASNANCGVTKYATNNSRTFKVTAYDLRLATDAHLPYQWVNTATDYDADPSKFPAYLRFDGVDDALQTGNINFTSTDKMTVWAGVDRLPGSATGVIVETSGSAFSSSGAFALFAHGTLGYEFTSRGTVLTDTVFNSSPPASPSIVTASFDIGGGSVVRRVNSQQSVIAANQGTGNYGNYPIYIGARSVSSIYLNGRLYSLIVRGAQSSLSQIEATELYIKQKMRMP